jgi:hypothetical protein
LKDRCPSKEGWDIRDGVRDVLGEVKVTTEVKGRKPHRRCQIPIRQLGRGLYLGP